VLINVSKNYLAITCFGH